MTISGGKPLEQNDYKVVHNGLYPTLWIGVPLIVEDPSFGMVAVTSYSDPAARRALENLHW